MKWTDDGSCVDRVPGWIDRGNALIYPEMRNEWARRIKALANEAISGTEIDTALDVMELIDNRGPFSEGKFALDSCGLSVNERVLAEDIILNFSMHGADFIEYVRCIDHAVLDPGERKRIKKLRRANKRYERRLGRELK